MRKAEQMTSTRRGDGVYVSTADPGRQAVKRIGRVAARAWQIMRHGLLTIRLAATLVVVATLGIGLNGLAVHAAPAVPVGSNLVANGDFETAGGNEVLDAGTWGWYTSLAGWSVCPGNPGSSAVIEYGSDWIGTAHSGTQYVELNSDAPSDVCQTISTVPGQSYQLSFWFSARPGTPLQDNQMDVTWAGTDLTPTPLSADGTALSDTNWTQYTYTVTATSNQTAIQFTDVGQAYDPSCGNCGSLLDDVSVLQLDTAPTVTNVAVPANPQAINTTVNVSATFTDPDVADARTATISWGDGATSAGTVADASGATPGTITGSHAYATDGVYQVTVTVTDSFNYSGSLTATTDTVIYDPSAGFVTGGGWITSPAGACLLTQDCGGATGRANFGFVSKYLKGATTPSGNTEFQFQAGGLDFHSTSYQWLVVSGSQAQYKGVGTINGQGTYGFLLTAQDAELSNRTLATDTFRIKIWDVTSGSTVYDNGAQSPIGGGDIVIHSS